MARVFDRLHLKHKLALILLVTVALVLAAVGVSLTVLIDRFYRDAAAQQFTTVFRTARDTLAAREAALTTALGSLSGQQEVVAGINMLSRYAAPADYHPLAFDPEGARLAGLLHDHARTAGIADVAAYAEDGRLLAFHRSAGGDETQTGYISYRDGEPQAMLRQGAAGGFVAAEPPEHVALRVPFAQQPQRVRHLRGAEGFALEAAAPVLRGYADGHRARVGHLVAVDYISEGFVAGVVGSTGELFAVVCGDGRQLGTIPGLEPQPLRAAPDISAHGLPLRLENDDFFLGVLAQPLERGHRAFFVAAVPKEQVHAAIRNTAAVVAGVLLLSALVLVPLGVRAAEHNITRPLEVLAAGAKAVQGGDYGRMPRLQRGDELGTLSRALAEMAGAVAQRERQLADSETKYRTLVENLPQRVFYKDSALRYVSCNQRFAEDVGMGPEGVCGRDDFDLFPRPLAERYREDDRRVMAGGRIEESEESYIADGRSVTVQMVKTPLYDGDGRCTGVLGIFWDITERKRAEEQLRQSAAVFESTGEGVMITDTDGVITAVNRAFSDISGYRAEEVIGQRPQIRRSERQGPEFYRAMWRAIHEHGRWQGEIWNRRKNGEVYPEWMTISTVRDNAGRPTHYVAVFSDITAIKRSQEELDHLAHHDPLTDLPNRVLLSDRLHHAMERSRRLNGRIAVLFCDLDRFKNVNDTLGHPVGDRVLQDVAQRLRTALREEDTVARLGGDEFVVMLEEVAHGREVEQTAAKLLDLFRAPFEVNGHEVYLGCSIGISLFPEDGSDVATLVKNADTAMFRAKETGRNTFRFYTRELTADAVERFELETALRQALARDQFVLYYQPQVELRSGRVVGAEALVRWQHPERGLVPPDRFIPLAEEAGLILDLGRWVLATACRAALRWENCGGAPLRVSVNLSGVQVQRGDLVATVREILRESGLPAGRLELEITESVLMEQPEQAAAVFGGLRALGVRLAVDDFGTGYSSLSYLKRFPIDALKVDKSFVRDIPEDANDVAITRAVVALAHSLQLEVVAEGVENAAQESFLTGEGCGLVQGYYYSRPVPPAEFERWLERRAATSCPCV